MSTLECKIIRYFVHCHHFVMLSFDLARIMSSRNGCLILSKIEMESHINNGYGTCNKIA